MWQFWIAAKEIPPHLSKHPGYQQNKGLQHYTFYMMSMDSWIDEITFPHRIAFPRLSLVDRLAGRNLYANSDWYDNVVIACNALPEVSMLLAASYELGRCAEQASGCRRTATRNVHIPSWGNLLSSVWSQTSHPTGIKVTAWLHYERHRTQDFDNRHPSIQWSTLASSP